MRTVFVFSMTAALVLGRPVALPAQDDPRAIIEKSIKALGGMEKVSQPMATFLRVQGTVPVIDGATFTGEFWSQGPDHIKHALHITTKIQKMTFTHWMKGDRGWLSLDGHVQPLDSAESVDARQSTYLDKVADLVPLLKEKTFSLKSLGPSKLDGRQVARITVSSTGKPDIQLFFETETGLLTKLECRARKEALGKEVIMAMNYSDYREPDLAAVDERALKAAGVAVDGPGLVAFLRGQVRSDDQKSKIQKLIKQLSDEAFEVREKATAELILLGSVALPFLREAAGDNDPEVARRAKHCLARIGEPKGPAQVSPSAMRLLALRKPVGAAEVLLALVPSTTDEAMKKELWATLTAVALRDGKPDPVVERALQDKNPDLKAAATAALARDGGAYAQRPGRRLFLTGLKRAMKVGQYQDGNKQVEWEVTEVEYYNKFDDSLFSPSR